MRPRSIDTRRGEIARRALAGALAIVLAVAAVVSGRSYFFCVPMEAVVETCCMATVPDPSDLAVDPAAPTLKGECCDTHAVGDLPASSVGAHGVELPPAVLAVTVIEPVVAWRAPATLRSLSPARTRRADPIRAGPGSGLDRAIALSVFRC